MNENEFFWLDELVMDSAVGFGGNVGKFLFE